uniref:DNA topoisomerase (ATP-hydrolyzing) n=1 Tax=viral metagenome TaxID=1070528 RepID=A0A6C0I1E6_9ZZZZ
MQTTTNSKKYVKMDPIEHVLLRSDMYVGSNKAQKTIEFVCVKDEDSYKILRKEISVSPAILRIFIEILSNATDNVERSRAAGIPCSYIKISINKETGETTVINDGDIIPIEINSEENMYNHSLIFGNLLTGSNYDDEEERLISGRNGIGSKASNIFSSKFTVKGVDPNNKLTFEQTWTNNMKDTTKPIIGKTKLSRGYTSVSYFPDFKQFGLSAYTDDIISIYLKYVIDVAMLSKVKVYFNEELIPVNNLQSYAKLYDCATDENLFLKHGNSEVLVTPSKEFQIVSFVNGIYTKLGGQHVDSWSEAIFRPLVDKFNKKGQPTLNIKDIKQFFRIFVVSYVVNPEFESQNKHKLENPKVPAVVKTSEIAKILKWSVIEEIEDIIKSKEILTLKKSEKKKKGYVKVEGLDPANKAGTKESHLCSLILCEGLSAKTYAVAGIDKGIDGVCGRDYYGVLALRGKCVSPETPILLWNGTIKQAKLVEIGDVLINDEGKQTTVTELFKGNDNMYEIQQNKGDNFTVNSEHTLTLKITNHCSIVWNEEKQRWKLSYFDKNDMKMKSRYVACVKNDEDLNFEKKENKCEESCCNGKVYSSRCNLTRHYKDSHPFAIIPSPSKRIPHNKSITTKEQGYIQIHKYMEEIESEDNVFDISIKEYLKLDNETKHLLKSFKLNNYVKWERKNVHIDPYILGMWLGDGFQTGYGFASEDVELINEWYKWCLKNDAEIVHNNRDSFTVRKKNCCKRGGDFKKIPIGTKFTSIKKCGACKEKMSLACASDEELFSMKCERVIEIVDYEHVEIYGDNPLVALLSKYNLINNKHIPLDYIINDKETRLKLLAGIIDTDGYVGDDGLIEICQSAEHKNILNSLVYICRSLGFYCNLSDKQAFYTDKLGNKIYKESYRLKISGNGIKEIPTKLLRKKLTHVFIRDARNMSFNIVEKGVGEYIGFQTDKTHRFLLGDFTVTHNCLNVRNSSMESIAKNKVITDLIQALNLQHGVDYTDENNFKNLSYGKVILLTDSDVDGKHITSLIMNFFHSLFPSILKRKTPFLLSMETPIIRVFKKEGDLLFYDENKFKEFSKNQTSKIKCKYYKGLGTTKSEDIKDTFGEKMVDYINDDNCDTSFNKVFHVKFADQRKEWLEKYDPKTSFSLDDSGKFSSMNLTDFLNNEMIKFSHDDCKRSIPHLFDGLKESQRKVLYSLKKRNLTYNKTSLKVAQLAGYVAEVSNYHHGEQNLFQTITKMANEFPGSNNIPLLYRDGQFGSRLALGADAANARYIFTKMEPLTPLIFREEDDILLERVYDDGDEVEPKFYIPIIPMVLVNGAHGIGSGWSSSIPCYNPLDIIECIEIWLKKDGKVIVEEEDSIISYLPDLVPWYRGFTGPIEKKKDSDSTFTTYGIIDKDKNKSIVSELPIGMSTDKFKEMTEDWLVDKKVKSVQNYSTPNHVYFVITESDDGFSCNLKNMKLHSYLYTSNMVLFNEKDQLKKYTTEEIINDFCIMRYEFYKKRKAHMISLLDKELRHLFNKARFVEDVISKKLLIMNVEEAIIVENLEKMGFDKENVKEDEENSGGYNYLLKMQVRTFTSNKVKQLRSEIEEKNNKLNHMKSTSEKQLWLNDLEEFKNEYKKWLKVMEVSPLKLKQKPARKKKET